MNSIKCAISCNEFLPREIIRIHPPSASNFSSAYSADNVDFDGAEKETHQNETEAKAHEIVQVEEQRVLVLERQLRR